MIDFNRTDYYECDKLEFKERTKNRLIELSNLGLEEVGYGQFGISHVVSGIYIEKLWSYSDEHWKEYVEWIVSLVVKKC